MNDIGYITETFKGSASETSIKTAQDYQLKNMLPYYTGAVEFHKKEQNPNQVVFFRSGAELINKRLSRINQGGNA